MNTIADRLPNSRRTAPRPACWAWPNAAGARCLAALRHPPAVRAAPARRMRPAASMRPGRALPALIDELRDSPVAIHTDAANAQHYEVPPAFFELCLGTRLKYSGCYYPTRRRDAGRSRGGDARAVRRARRAGRRPGHPRARLRLGLAHAVDGAALSRTRASPRSPTRARSASTSRRECRERGLDNVRVLTRDVNQLRTGRRAASTAACRSRCSSTCATTRRCCRRIARWLRPAASCSCTSSPPHLHVSVRDRGRGQLDGPALLHRRADAGGRHPAVVPAHLRIEQRWLVDGTHYQRTAEPLAGRTRTAIATR